MKIAIIADPIDNQKGGVHVYTRELVAGLRLHPGGHDYVLIRERFDPAIMDMKQIVIPNIRVGLGLAALRLFFIVPLVLWWHRVDAVFEPAHFGPFNLPSRIKRITMIHDMTPILFPQYHRFHSQWLQKIFLGGILRRANLVMANSQHTARDIQRFFPATSSKITTILLGCEPAMKPTVERQWLDMAGVNTPYWLAVGTIEPRKNLIRLLEAYQLFREKSDVFMPLLIVGERGWKADPFYECLANHPYKKDIILTGYVSDQDLASLYSYAKGLIYPSIYEGFGLPVLEAMACGCPVICSQVSSLPEVGGDAVLYIDPLDTTTILRQMIVLSTMSLQDYRVICKQSLERATLFSWDAYTIQWLAAIETLFSDKTFIKSSHSSYELSDQPLKKGDDLLHKFFIPKNVNNDIFH